MRNTYLKEEAASYEMYAPVVSLPLHSIKQNDEWNLVKIALRIVALLVILFAAELAFATEKNLVAIPVLKEQLAKGTIVKMEHIGSREMNPRSIAKTAIWNKQEIIGLEATRTLRPGNPIYQGYVRVVPDVHRSQNVSMDYRVEGIQLSTLGRALEDGNIGASIRVMNNSSQKIVIGTVIAKNKVRVE
jgi:flagella basal body P-ring formation protein FlgA